MYGFANGDPVNFADPFSLCVAVFDCPITIGIGAGVWIAGVLAGTVVGVFVVSKWEDIKDKARRTWRRLRVAVSLVGQLNQGDPLPPRPDDDPAPPPPIHTPKSVAPVAPDSTTTPPPAPPAPRNPTPIL